MKKILLALLAAAIYWPSSELLAQQEPQFTHYMFNKLVYNPAWAGARPDISADLLYHNQWSRFTGQEGEGAPITSTFAIYSALPISIGSGDRKRQPFGAGFHAYSDREGWISTTGALLSASYNQVINRIGNLRGGINVGFANKSLDPTWKFEEPNDTRIPGTSSSTAFDAGAGLYLSNPTWYAGVSALHLPAAQVTWKTQSAEADYKITRTYFLTAGYNYAIGGNQNYMLMPSVFYKQDQARGSFALNAMFLYNQRFWGALNYRTEALTATSVMLGMYVLPKLNIGVAYDVPTSGTGAFGGTFEVFVGYAFGIAVKPDTEVTPMDPRHLGHPRTPKAF